MVGRLKQLQTELLRELSLVATQEGFNSKPRGQSFYRTTPFGWVSLHLSFIPHGTSDFDVTSNAILRVDAVERLIGEGPKAERGTMGVELGNLSQGKPKRWTVASEADVKPVAAAIGEAWRTIAIPYLQRYSNLSNMLSLLSRNDLEAAVQNPFHDMRCKRAVALAFLLGQYERMERLIEQGASFLRSRGDGELQSFLDFSDNVRALCAQKQRTELG